MMEGLAPIDGWAVLAIMAKTADYVAALLVMGGPLFMLAFRAAPVDVLRLARMITFTAVLVGIAILALRFGIRAARISGMGLDGATNTMMLGFVWDSPLGTAAIWRSVGAFLVLAVYIEGIVSIGIAFVGGLLIASSYTFVGHSLADPRWILASFLTVHLLVAAFWIASLVPLYRVAEQKDAPILLHRFGKIASATVTVLVIVGMTFAWLMVGSITALFTTAYGWVLLTKLAFVTGLMGLAAHNKWRLVPALEMGEASAATHLKRSILIEIIAIFMILIATATLTSVTTPPINL
jgi:putative copper resistance protein D